MTVGGRRAACRAGLMQYLPALSDDVVVDGDGTEADAASAAAATAAAGGTATRSTTTTMCPVQNDIRRRNRFAKWLTRQIGNNYNMPLSI